MAVINQCCVVWPVQAVVRSGARRPAVEEVVPGQVAILVTDRAIRAAAAGVERRDRRLVRVLEDSHQVRTPFLSSHKYPVLTGPCSYERATHSTVVAVDCGGHSIKCARTTTSPGTYQTLSDRSVITSIRGTHSHLWHSLRISAHFSSLCSLKSTLGTTELRSAIITAKQVFASAEAK